MDVAIKSASRREEKSGVPNTAASALSTASAALLELSKHLMGSPLNAYLSQELEAPSISTAENEEPTSNGTPTQGEVKEDTQAKSSQLRN